MSLALQCSVFGAGALCYATYFNHGEHHMHGMTYIKAHTAAFAVFGVLLYRPGFAILEAVKLVGAYDGIFLAGLFASLLFYRAFLHPLNIFPGPWLAQISSFYMTGRIQRMRMYKTLQEMHEKYGYFVRIGTQELSISHPSAMQEVFGADSVCQKSPWYDISRPQDSLLLRRTFEGHAELRSVWSQAFSVKAVKGYELRMKTYRDKLIAQIDSHHGQPVDVNHWLGLYSWDVLSDLSFGHAFGMLDTKEHHWAMNVLDKGMSIVGFHLPMWVIRILMALPGGNKDTKFMLKYCEEEMLRRWEADPKVPDVMSALFMPYKKNQKPFDNRALNLLAGESHLLINAGSDTTRVTMACTLFTLAQQPDLANRLREALAPYVDPFSTDLLMDDQIMDVDLLNGVVQEALRMYPPSPSHPTRVTPPEGTTIGGQFVPGGTQLIVPQYVIGRDERVFAQADEFIPERWYSRPELIKIKNATAPFSLGPMNCVGKQLAMANVRVTLAMLVMRYDFKFAPSRNDPTVVFEQGMHEHFSMQPGPLLLNMEKRKK
ncbi:cytochrome P450 monooxygenase [Astrocystis sublimbata]|nr:cytochrome P450 monooxygenase [Astrocystis sublimbata]